MTAAVNAAAAAPAAIAQRVEARAATAVRFLALVVRFSIARGITRGIRGETGRGSGRTRLGTGEGTGRIGRGTGGGTGRTREGGRMSGGMVRVDSGATLSDTTDGTGSGSRTFSLEGGIAIESGRLRLKRRLRKATIDGDKRRSGSRVFSLGDLGTIVSCRTGLRGGRYASIDGDQKLENTVLGGEILRV